MLSRLVITFLPRSKCLLISWLQSLSAVILEPRKIKSVTVSTVSLSICHKVIGPDAMILVFWILSFKPTFLIFSLIFTKRLFSSSSLSAISVVSSAYWYFSWQSWFQLVLPPAQHLYILLEMPISKNGKNRDFPSGSVVKNPPANTEDMGLIPGWERSLEKEMATSSSILACGQRNLAGCSPWGCKEADTTESLNRHEKNRDSFSPGYYLSVHHPFPSGETLYHLKWVSQPPSACNHYIPIKTSYSFIPSRIEGRTGCYNHITLSVSNVGKFTWVGCAIISKRKRRQKKEVGSVSFAIIIPTGQGWRTENRGQTWLWVMWWLPPVKGFQRSVWPHLGLLLYVWYFIGKPGLC